MSTAPRHHGTFPYIFVLPNLATRPETFQEFFWTAFATICYVVAFIVIFSGFNYCAGTPKCDARIAAGVSLLHRLDRKNIFFFFRTQLNCD
jgi:hypothetical protein